MQGVALFGAVAIGLVAGWIATRRMSGGHGVVSGLSVGLVGALIGGFLANAMGWVWAGAASSLAISTLGAVILLTLLRSLRLG